MRAEGLLCVQKGFHACRRASMRAKKYTKSSGTSGHVLLCELSACVLTSVRLCVYVRACACVRESMCICVCT